MTSPRRKRPRSFLSEDERRAVVGAIESAERRTSGEIRVHLEHHCRGGDPYERARQLFEQLGMTATAARNGVLIYLATGDGLFAVIGDRGIHEQVGEDFWDDVVERMQARFRVDDFAGGLVEGIAMVGEKLATFFPHRDDDVNELSDDISIGD